MAVAELAAAASLLLVAPVGLRGTSDRLVVGHAGRLERYLGAEALSHPIDDHLHVHLGQAGHDLLAGLRVAVHVDRRVLLLQAPQSRVDLLLIALRLGLHRECHHRPWQVRHVQVHVAVLGGEHVSGVGLLQLGHCADVPGAELIRVLVLLALGHERLADALLGVRAAVEDVGVVLDHALGPPGRG